MNRPRPTVKKSKRVVVVHLLDLSTDFGPGPDTDRVRCGADIFESVLALSGRLVTCPACKGKGTG